MGARGSLVSRIPPTQIEYDLILDDTVTEYKRKLNLIATQRQSYDYQQSA